MDVDVLNKFGVEMWENMDVSHLFVALFDGFCLLTLPELAQR